MVRGTLAAMSPTHPSAGDVVRPATTAGASALGACHNACWRQAYRHQLSARFLATFDDAARAEMRIEEWEGLATIRLLR